MKKIFLQFILFISLSNLTFAQTNIYDSIFVGGRWRTFLTHLPTGYNTSNNYPLVLAFHGGGLLGYPFNINRVYLKNQILQVLLLYIPKE
jgi:enterochelin esterase-like enzyme